MPARFLWTLLIVSLALNVFFVGGVLYSKLSDEQGEWESDAAMASVSDDLGLSDEQQKGLADLRDKIRARWQEVRAAKGEVRDAMLAELGKPKLDEDAVRELAEKRGAPRRAAILDTVKDMHAYLATLSESQRIQFLDMAKEPGFFRNLFGRPKSSS